MCLGHSKQVVSVSLPNQSWLRSPRLYQSLLQSNYLLKDILFVCKAKFLHSKPWNSTTAAIYKQTPVRRCSHACCMLHGFICTRIPSLRLICPWFLAVRLQRLIYFFLLFLGAAAASRSFFSRASISVLRALSCASFSSFSA